MEIKFEKFEELQSDMVQTVWSQRKVFELSGRLDNNGRPGFLKHMVSINAMDSLTFLVTVGLHATGVKVIYNFKIIPAVEMH